MTTSQLSLPLTISVTRRRFTVDQFQQMAAAGILSPDERVELIDGEIIEMAPIGDPHGGYVDICTDLFYARFRDVANVRVQGPVKLNQFVQVQPDLAVLQPRSDRYVEGGVWPENVYLLIEVADSSLRYDREVKALLYARAGIQDYWLLDVERRTLTVLRDPSPEGYRSVQTLRRGDRLALLAFPDRELAVSELLGEA